MKWILVLLLLTTGCATKSQYQIQETRADLAKMQLAYSNTTNQIVSTLKNQAARIVQLEKDAKGADLRVTDIYNRVNMIEQGLAKQIEEREICCATIASPTEPAVNGRYEATPSKPYEVSDEQPV